MATNARASALAALHVARGIAPAMGFHRVRVVVRTRTWSSGRVQTGTAANVDLVLGAPDPSGGATLPPHVKGTAGDPEIEVGPLTPFDVTAAPRGFTVAQLNPALVPGVEYYYVVTFPDGVPRPYILAPRGLNTDRALHYTVKLRALDRATPF
jgi:hypothetical protein